MMMTVITEPEWFKIWMDDPTDTEGEVLCSFQLLPFEDAARVPMPDLKPA